jgi:hypothetical protein
MKRLLLVLLVAAMAAAQSSAVPEMPATDAVRLREFYSVMPTISSKVWPGWEKTPAPLLLVTKDTEFLTHHPAPPKDFTRIETDLYERSRQFPTQLLATFPAFGPLSVIVIGEPENTLAKTSTPWLITLMHEHFHQLQDGQPNIFSAMNDLGLARGDNTGMWMLNYAFPYEDAEVAKEYSRLRDMLLATLEETDSRKFQKAAQSYVAMRKAFFAKLSRDDAKYLNFQIWKEGVARYIQILCAEEAAKLQPSSEYQKLSDYESFESYSKRARKETLDELRKSDLAKSHRVAVYAFGAGEAMLLDRMNPKWREGYFEHLFTLELYFQ